MDTKSEYNEDYSQTFNHTKQKIVLIGDIAVGKTSIINSILESKFKDSYEVKIKTNQKILIFKIKYIQFFSKIAYNWGRFFYEVN